MAEKEDGGQGRCAIGGRASSGGRRTSTVPRGARWAVYKDHESSGPHDIGSAAIGGGVASATVGSGVSGDARERISVRAGTNQFMVIAPTTNKSSKGFPWTAGTTTPDERTPPDRALRRTVVWPYCACDVANRWVLL